MVREAEMVSFFPFSCREQLMHGSSPEGVISYEKEFLATAVADIFPFFFLILLCVLCCQKHL